MGTNLTTGNHSQKANSKNIVRLVDSGGKSSKNWGGGELSGLIVLGASCPDTKDKHKAHLDTVANLYFYF